MPSPADAGLRASGAVLTTALRRSLQSVPVVGTPVFGETRDRLLLALVIGYTVLVTASMAVGAAGPAPAGWSGGLALLPLGLAALALAIRAGREQALDRGSRTFWRIVALAVTVLAIVQVASDVVLRPRFPAAAETTAMLAPVIAELLVLLGFRWLPNAPRSVVDRAKLSIDLLTVAVAGLLVTWYDSWMVGDRAIPMGPFALLHLQATMALMLMLVVSVAWARTALRHGAQVLAVLGAALLLQFVAHVAAIVQLTVGGSAVDVVRMVSPISLALVAVAAWLTSATAMQRTLRRRHERDRLAGSLIPYVAVLPGFVLLLRLAYTDVATSPGAEPLQALAVGVVVLTFLAFARQFTSTTDAARGLAEVTARNNEARFQALVQHSSDVIMILDPDGTIRYASPSVTAVFGHDPARLAATPLEAMLHPDDAPAARQFLADLARPLHVFSDVAAPGAMKREWRLRHANGTWLTVDNVGTNLLREPVIQGLVLNTRDVTEQSIIKQQYMHQAFHDPLTDLANRSLFLYQVGHALARAQRTAGTVTVLFLDLDNFKTVNDSLGHAAGDHLLVEAARRLAVCVRESDLIARLGGDEFAVLVEQTASVEEVLHIAGRIRTALSTPFALGGKEVFVNASIGIARTSSGETTDELVRNADLAMYVAKGRGKGQHVLFEPTMHHAALERLVVEADLRQALEREEFLLQYQPIVALDTGEIIGAEALVRWLCRERGRVAPGVFIPIAEETGLIVPIGRWVLRRACREAQRWTRERGLPVRITVNLSGRQLQEPGIVDDVREALVDSGLSPGQLVLEITESMLMHDTVLSMARLTALKALGVSLALDDFGTGYSSLSYLQRYPIDILKIDKAFVDDIDQGGEGPVLASAIIALGATLRMNTVAEGIETEPQRGQLLALGCQLGQGFLFSPPLDAEEFWHLLLARGARTPYTTLRRREMSAQAA